jgi:hypothetical protein
LIGVVIEQPLPNRVRGDVGGRMPTRLSAPRQRRMNDRSLAR